MLPGQPLLSQQESDGGYGAAIVVRPEPVWMSKQHDSLVPPASSLVDTLLLL